MQSWKCKIENSKLKTKLKTKLKSSKTENRDI